jgi:hypothetical protein
MQRDRYDDLSIRRTVGPEGLRLRRAHMAQAMIGLAVMVILTAMLPSPAGAQTFNLPPQSCWILSPFVDTLLVNSVTAEDGSTFNLNIRWRANAAAGQQAAGGAGPATYQLLGSGTATPSLSVPNSFEMGFQAVHNTTFFGGNRGCNFYAVGDNATNNVTWTVQCPGPTSFTTGGNLTFVGFQDSCPDNF